MLLWQEVAVEILRQEVAVAVANYDDKGVGDIEGKVAGNKDVGAKVAGATKGPGDAVTGDTTGLGDKVAGELPVENVYSGGNDIDFVAGTPTALEKMADGDVDRGLDGVGFDSAEDKSVVD
jgi:hypothetical protein